MKKSVRNLLRVGECALSALPLGAWVWFTVLTRNSFRLDSLDGQARLVCLLLTILPAVCVLAGAMLRHRWGLTVCILFGLGVCGWLLTLGTQWSVWSQAAAMETITRLQLQRLRLCALAGLGACLAPTLVLGLELGRRRDS